MNNADRDRIVSKPAFELQMATGIGGRDHTRASRPPDAAKV